MALLLFLSPILRFVRCLTFLAYLASAVLATCMMTFFVVNVFNIRRGIRSRRGIETFAEVPEPSGYLEYLAEVATVLLFLLSALYIALTLFGVLNTWSLALIQLGDFEYIQALGVVISVAGYLLFIWSVLARGRYSVSWSMPRDQKLVTWGPYRYIRHPSYTGYFLMFLGLILIWLNLIAAIPLLGAIGYVKIAEREEQLLTKRFGEEYIAYQGRTGRFVPKIT